MTNHWSTQPPALEARRPIFTRFRVLDQDIRAVLYFPNGQQPYNLHAWRNVRILSVVLDKHLHRRQSLCDAKVSIT